MQTLSDAAAQQQIDSIISRLERAAEIEKKQAEQEGLKAEQLQLLQTLQHQQAAGTAAPTPSPQAPVLASSADQLAGNNGAQASTAQGPSATDRNANGQHADVDAVLKDSASTTLALQPGYNVSVDLPRCLTAHVQAVLRGTGGVALAGTLLDASLVMDHTSNGMDPSSHTARQASRSSILVDRRTNLVHALYSRDTAALATAAAVASKEGGVVDGMSLQDWQCKHLNFQADGTLNPARCGGSPPLCSQCKTKFV
jgi:hypothetical protein